MRKGAAWVAAKSRFVFMVPEGMERLAEDLLPLPDPVWVERYHFRGEEELTLRYLLVLDALNFCFWPPAGFPHRPAQERWMVLGPEGERLTGYYALSFALRRLALESPGFFVPEHLAAVTEGEVAEVLGQIPLPFWRAMALREVGQALLRFGSAQNFFAQAQGSAKRLVELLTAHLPMFRDAALYDGRWIPFYKRAQILVADLWGTFEGKGPGAFRDLSWLTAFADYKLPQILWASGVLRVHPRLAERIKKGEIIPWGSPSEVEIRALTVVAVEKLVEKLREKGREVLPFQVDWLLWNLAQRGLGVPHHRTLTWAY
ncbi:MAG: queuosine 5'-phosphate N-glycosylase/hydrolase [Candidatus Bipolaricaulaceae bacterium]